jgi:mannose-6-phosphate isomerase
MVGEAVDGRPWAEWWMGTHPLAPSTLDDGSALESVAGDLPYLLKFMAAAQPLSLQTHPDKGPGEAGFEEENHRGIPLDAPNRIYRDRSAKPEMLCALTSFDTLCGFRRSTTHSPLLNDIGALDLARICRTRSCLRPSQRCTEASSIRRRRSTPAAATTAPRRTSSPNSTGLPGDPSVAVTLLLNRVMLTAGEAIFLGPGNLHAYLRGFGVEVMANSDNVVRGG